MEPSTPEEDARLIVGWLLDIVLRGPAHEFDRELAVRAAKQFLGVEETAQ